jgi:hypothetical protein
VSASSKREAGELDLALKAKLQRALAATGHYTRLDVKVALESRESSGARYRNTELTDIDVLGVMFDADLRPAFVAGDCTTRTTISPSARVFWLHGVMAFFEAARGFIVLTRAIGAHERHVASMLGIDLLSESDLDRWLARLAAPENAETHRVAQWLELERGLAQLPPALQELVDYRKYGFWQDAPNQAILRLVRLVKYARAALDGRDRWHRALVADLAALLSLALLRMAHGVFHVPTEALPDAARNYLFGGSRGVRMREHFLDKVRQIAGASSERPKLLEDIALEPTYWAPLLEVVARLVERPIDARRLPVEIDDILYNYSPADGQPISVARKRAWDVGRFLVRSAALAPSFAQIFGVPIPSEPSSTSGAVEAAPVQGVLTPGENTRS